MAFTGFFFLRDKASFLPRCCIVCVHRWYHGCVHGNRLLRATGQRGESKLITRTQRIHSSSLFDDAGLRYQSIHCSFFSLFDANGILPLRYIIASPAWGAAMEGLQFCTPQSSTFLSFSTYILSGLILQLVSPIRTYNIDYMDTPDGERSPSPEENEQNTILDVTWYERVERSRYGNNSVIRPYSKYL